MKNKGFTLIELLAVIVILAIIALIATPIILGIINDARESSQKRSIELYRVSVANAVAAEAMRHPNHKIVGEFKSSANGRQLLDGNTPILFIDYEGSVVSCNIVRVYEDGKVEVDECTVDGVAVGFTPEEDVPSHYSNPYSEFGVSINGSLPGGVVQSSTSFGTRVPYFGYKTSNDKIDKVYICFKDNSGIEHCMSKANSPANNKKVFEDVFGNNTCSTSSGEYYCEFRKENNTGVYAYIYFESVNSDSCTVLTVVNTYDCATSQEFFIQLDSASTGFADHPDNCEDECEGCDEDPEEFNQDEMDCEVYGGTWMGDYCEYPDPCAYCAESGCWMSEETGECIYPDENGEENPEEGCWYCENEDDPESCYSIC